MATQLWFQQEFGFESDYASGNNDADLRGNAVAWNAWKLASARGSSTTSSSEATVTGPTAGLEVGYASTQPYVWYSAPIDADVTVSGSITWNLWAFENNMSANVAINGRLEVIDGATGTVTLIDQTARVTEVNIGSMAVNNFAETPAAGVLCKKGDRLRARVFADDVGTMASGFTWGFSFNGPTAAADGDSYIQLTETITFASEPAGSQIFLTNTAASGLNAASLLTSFTGSNESPLSDGGNWAQLNTSDLQLQRTSNAARGSTAGPTNHYSYWTAANFGPDLEMYATLTVPSGSVVLLDARIQGEGGANTFDGYAVRVNSGEQGSIARVTNAVNSALAFGNAGTAIWGTGDKLGFSLQGNQLRLYRWTGSLWQYLATLTDSTYQAAGKIGVYASTSGSGIDDLFVSTDVAGTFTVAREAWTSRGAGVQTDVTTTVAGWVSPQPVTDTAGGAAVEWFTRPLAAFTLGGAVRCNIRGTNSFSGSISEIAGVEIAVTEGDGSRPVIWATGRPTTPNGIDQTTEQVESFLISGDDVSVSGGQRLRIRVFLDDSTFAAMVTSRTITTQYAGTSGGASGDTFLTFSQTLTEGTGGGSVPPRRTTPPAILAQ